MKFDFWDKYHFDIEYFKGVVVVVPLCYSAYVVRMADLS